MKKIIVAIDGYSSCGKSTIAKALAKYAGYMYVDTGAMYRATALYMLQHHADEPAQIIALLPKVSIRFALQTDGTQHTILNGQDVELQIRTLEVGNRASQVSQIREVRQFLVAQQQAMGKEKGIVMDGRDIGTVVFPEAELKLFLTALPEVRAPLVTPKQNPLPLSMVTSIAITNQELTALSNRFIMTCICSSLLIVLLSTTMASPA